MVLRPLLLAMVAAVVVFSGGVARSQQVTISLPSQSFSDGYFEYFGTRWSYCGPGFWWHFGGLPPPAFGGFDPAAGLTGGWTFGSDGRCGRLNFIAAAGRSTLYTSTTPYLTVTEGVPGSLFVGRTVPFVTGVIPVTTGGGPAILNPELVNLGAANDIRGRLLRGEMHILNGRIHAGPDPLRFLPPEAAPRLVAAGPGAAAEAPRGNPLPAAAPGLAVAPVQPVSDPVPAPGPPWASEAERLWHKGTQLEAEGKPGAARLLYQTALRTATGEMRERIATRLRELPGGSDPPRAAESPEVTGEAPLPRKLP